MVHFPGTEYRTHTVSSGERGEILFVNDCANRVPQSCMTEEQKYQGSTYKAKKSKPNETETATKTDNMAHNAYVEDVTEEYEAYRDYEIRESDGEDGKVTGNMPEAPSPPRATATASSDPDVNVFDFLVQATPNASNLDLQHTRRLVNEPTHTRQLVRFESDPNDYIEGAGLAAGLSAGNPRMVQYGDGPVSVTQYETPAPKSKKSKDSESKKDKKRKRLHIETPGPLALKEADQVMTDAPPVLHSGLTGGMDRMMRPSQFPPSPDYSGGDGAENSPVPPSPIKKTKQHKSSKAHRVESHGLKALLTGTSRTKASSKKKALDGEEGQEEEDAPSPSFLQR